MEKIKSLLMPYSVYTKTHHVEPYFFKINKSGKTLYYFGSNHSRDPQDGQYIQIKKYWSEFSAVTKPENSLVFVEGGIRESSATEQETIHSDAEAGFITMLALKDGYETFSPEPDRETEIKHLISKYSREEIQYYYFATVINQWGRFIKKPGFETYVGQFLENDKLLVRWKDFDFSLENMKKIHKLLFRGKFDEWNVEFFNSVANPTFRTTIINCFAQDKGVVRDAFIVSKILEKWKEGSNIFVVFGHTHAVMQEPALKKLM